MRAQQNTALAQCYQGQFCHNGNVSSKLMLIQRHNDLDDL